jgi:hypothetical protein
MLALIDGDIVVYNAGFANVERSYTCEDGTAWRYKKDAVDHCNQYALDISSIKKEVEDGPLDFALANIKKIINKIKTDTECDDYQIFLSGDENRRKLVDPTYKANRDEEHKPAWFNEMKEYLVERHGAIVTEYGAEADDYMGAYQNDDGSTIICTLDKDLNQITGWHYNWSTGEKTWIDSEEADMFFWKQMLTGDTADNIKGIYGVGPKTADRMLAGVPKHKRRCVVGLAYAVHFDEPEKKFLDNAELLYIDR